MKVACKNGDIVLHTFAVCNSGSEVCPNAVAEISIPQGLELITTFKGDIKPIVTKGQYNVAEDKWYIGTLLPNEEESITTEFKVVDDTKFIDSDFIVSFSIISSCTESNMTDNIQYLCIEKQCEATTENSCKKYKIKVT